MSVQLALKRTQDGALERLTVAATEGDLDIVKNLLARGLPINQVSARLIMQFHVRAGVAVHRQRSEQDTLFSITPEHDFQSNHAHRRCLTQATYLPQQQSSSEHISANQNRQASLGLQYL
jgi:hypothetical protein